MKRYYSLSALFSLTLLIGCGSEEPRRKVNPIRPVKTVVVPKPEAEMIKKYPGIVDADQQSILSFLVEGKLVKLNVKTGDEVKKGQILAELDNRDYMNAYQASLARKNEAEVDFKRSKELLDKGVETKASYDVKSKDYTVAVNDLAVKKKALSDTQLIAPFSGVISKKYVDNFEDVNAKEEILLLQDISTLNVIINVPEDIIKRHRKSDNSKFYSLFSNVDDRRFPLTVKEYSTESDAATQTYEVTFFMKPVEGLSIFPGMSTTVEQVTSLVKEGGSQQYYRLPIDAVANDAKTDSSYCWLVDMKTMKVKKRAVVLESLSKSEAIVKSGLSTGDVVVSAGVSYLIDDQQITILDK